MENRAHALLAVAFLVLLAAGGAYLYYWMQAPRPEPRIYRVVSPHSVGSLRAESEVTYKGLVVGHVKAVRFHPEDPDKVVIRVGLQPGIPVTEATYAELGARGLTGATYLALKKDPEGSDRPLATSPQDPARLPMRPGAYQGLMTAAQDIARQVQRLSRQMNRLTGEANRERVAGILDQTGDVLDRVEELATAFRPGAARLDRVLAETERAAREGRRTLARIGELARSAGDEVEQLGEAARAVRGLGESGQEVIRQSRRRLLPRLDTLAERFDRIAGNLQELSEVLREQPQAVIYGPPEGPPGPGEEGFGWHQPGREERP